LIFYKIFHLCNLIFFYFYSINTFCVSVSIINFICFSITNLFWCRNSLNTSCCDVKYFDFHLSLKFFLQNLSIILVFFFFAIVYFFIMYLNKKNLKKNYNLIGVHNLVYRFCVLALIIRFIGLMSSLTSRICIFSFWFVNCFK
jgi:hypothetical protein